MSQIIKDEVRELSAVKDLLKLWQRDALRTHRDCEEQLRIYEMLFVEGLAPLLLDLSTAKRSATLWDALMTVKTVSLTWGDTVSDIFAIVVLLRAGSGYATPALVSLMFANCMQGLMTHFLQRESAYVIAAALLGLKPLVDGFKIVFGIEDAGTFDARFSFAVSRTIETGVETVPQLILQALALAGVDAVSRATGQYISIAWSILNLAYSFVDVTFALDTAEMFRDIEPLYYGIIMQTRENAMQFALGLFILGYICAKLLAVALLGSVSGIALSAWLSGECTAL